MKLKNMIFGATQLVVLIAVIACVKGDHLRTKSLIGDLSKSDNSNEEALRPQPLVSGKPMANDLFLGVEEQSDMEPFLSWLDEADLRGNEAYLLDEGHSEVEEEEEEEDEEEDLHESSIGPKDLEVPRFDFDEEADMDDFDEEADMDEFDGDNGLEDPLYEGTDGDIHDFEGDIQFYENQTLTTRLLASVRYNKITRKHCFYNKFPKKYRTMAEAKRACARYGSRCHGIYDSGCRNGARGIYICKSNRLSRSGSSCVYKPTRVNQRTSPKKKSAIGDFCWKTSYGRGVGRPLSQCPGRDKIGLLCYSKCPRGMKRFGFDCHSVCPRGWRNDGLFCAAGAYGRGWGFPWKFGDWFSDSGMFRRCEARHGRGRCEKCGLIVYPKCKSGYRPTGCNICSPESGICRRHNMGRRVFDSCAKKIKIGDPIPMKCKSHEEENAGLCYKKCKKGFTGVGPVCWGQNPRGWVGCGMGSAKSSFGCAKIIGSQVMSVGMLAKKVAGLIFTGGATNAATNSAEAPVKFKRFWAMVDKIKGLKNMFMNSKLVTKGSKIAPHVSRGKKAGSFLQVLQKAKSKNMITVAYFVRLQSLLISIFDPSGVASVVSSYSYDTCDKIHPNRRNRYLNKKEQKDVFSEVVALFTQFKTYLSDAQGGTLVHQSSYSDVHEEWTMTWDSKNRYSFQSENGKYLGARADGSIFLSDVRLDRTRFWKIDDSDSSTFRLKTSDGLYIGASNTNGTGEELTLQIESPGHNPVYYMMSNFAPSNLLAANPDGSLFPAKVTGNAERFKLLQHRYDGTVTFMSVNKHFLNFNSGDGSFSSTTIGEAEKFVRIINSDGSSSFKAQNNQYMMLDSLGIAKLTSSHGDSNRFWMGKPIRSFRHGTHLSGKFVNIVSRSGACLEAGLARDELKFKSDCSPFAQWEIVDNDDGTDSLKTRLGTYLGLTYPDGNFFHLPVTGDDQEKWRLVWHDDGTVSFESKNEMYVSANQDGTIDSAPVAQGGEKFWLLPLASPIPEPWAVVDDESKDGVALRSQSGLFLSWKHGDRPSLSNKNRDTEKWEEVFNNDLTESYKVWNKEKYLTVPANGKIRFYGSINGWQKFNAEAPELESAAPDEDLPHDPTEDFVKELKEQEEEENEKGIDWDEPHSLDETPDEDLLLEPEEDEDFSNGNFTNGGTENEEEDE